MHSRAWLKSGATMNSMKLIWLSACEVVLRSIMGDTGSPAARSRSPCAKNSSSTRTDHLHMAQARCHTQGIGKEKEPHLHIANVQRCQLLCFPLACNASNSNTHSYCCVLSCYEQSAYMHKQTVVY